MSTTEDNLVFGLNYVKVQLSASSPAFYDILDSLKLENNRLIIKFTPTKVEMLDGQPEITLRLVGSERVPK